MLSRRADAVCMNQYDRNRVSRLPAWRSFESSQPAPEGTRARSPIIRPTDFVPPPPPEPEPLPARPVVSERHASEPAPAPSSRAIPPVRETLHPPAEKASVVAGPLLDIRSAVGAVWSRRLIVACLCLL